MLYRENGQFKTNYSADQQIFPIAQDRWVILAFVAFAFIGVPLLVDEYMFRAILIPFLILALAALCTAFYITRLNMLTFEGTPRDKKAYDLLIQSESGFLSVTGTPDSPSKAGCSIADIAAGMYAYTNILSALIQRQKTNKGCNIDVSMLESMVEWMNYPMYYAYEGAEPPVRAGAAHATIYPYGPFIAGDGKSVMLGLQNEREWASFCEVVLKAPQLAADVRFKSNADRAANRIELKAIIDHTFSALTAEQVVKLLEDAQIANAHVNDMHDVWNHPQLKARDRWVSVGTSEGPIPALLPPGRTNAFNPRMDAVPGLGQHSESILSELGFSNERIQSMRHAKAI